VPGRRLAPALPGEAGTATLLLHGPGGRPGASVHDVMLAVYRLNLAAVAATVPAPALALLRRPESCPPDTRLARILTTLSFATVLTATVLTGIGVFFDHVSSPFLL
jgi:hypothetical protein